MKIHINITGDKEVQKYLAKFAKSIIKWKPELKSTGEYLKNTYTNQVFETEGSILGSPWAKLNPQYDYWKRKNFGGRGTLERTGKMRRGFGFDAGDTEVEISNKIPYAVFHQFGTSRMPKRLLMDVSTDMENNIVKIFVQGVKDRIG